LLLGAECSRIRQENEIKAFIWAYPQANDGYTFRFLQSDEERDDSQRINMVAASSTSNMIDKIGWVVQSVGSNKAFPDSLQAYWAGYLETNQTRRETEAHFVNTMKWLCDPPSKCAKLLTWLKTNFDYMMQQAKANENDPFWYQCCQAMPTFTLRMTPVYNFPWQVSSRDRSSIAGAVMSLSSYPSTWTSIDDYYLVDSGLTVIETTNEVYNSSLMAIVKDNADKSVLEVFRVMVANRLARTGKEWVQFFSKQNSGTYNNQWMILDRKLFRPGQPLPNKDFFVVAEQMPGLIHWEDMSMKLAQDGYWASFNLAYFPEVQEYSGQNEQEKEEGDLASHDKCPRARIFRRDQDKVRDLKGMYNLMRYNEFDVDPLSRCECQPPYSGELAIAARSDLNPPDGTSPSEMLEYRLHGATDTKLSNINMSSVLAFVAISSPSYEHLPAFQWSKLPVPHERPSMHPDKFMFPPVMFSPETRNNTIHVDSAAYLSRWQH
ncbi:putative phospholipase B-like 2, partial [Cichlidogyrus casuarinus]